MASALQVNCPSCDNKFTHNQDVTYAINARAANSYRLTCPAGHSSYFTASEQGISIDSISNPHVAITNTSHFLKIGSNPNLSESPPQ